MVVTTLIQKHWKLGEGAFSRCWDRGWYYNWCYCTESKVVYQKTEPIGLVVIGSGSLRTREAKNVYLPMDLRMLSLDTVCPALTFLLVGQGTGMKDA